MTYSAMCAKDRRAGLRPAAYERACRLRFAFWRAARHYSWARELSLDVIPGGLVAWERVHRRAAERLERIGAAFFAAKEA